MDGDNTNTDVAKPAVELHLLQDDKSFIEDINQFYNEPSLSDVVLLVGSQTFHAHRFVLAKSSPVFRTMLYSSTWKDNEQQEITLSESPECECVFHVFLKYLYSAQILMSENTAVGILCLADKYQVESLRTLCQKYMVELSRSPKVQVALHWYPWAKALHLPQLLLQCCQTISWNFNSIMALASWTQTDADFLLDFLGSSELVVANEFSVWQAVTHWLNIEDRVKYIDQLVPLIRFPQMQVDQLYMVEQHTLTQLALVQDLVSSAYRFRALCPSQQALGVKFTSEFYQPRDYTDHTVDIVRMQNSLRFGIQIEVKLIRGPVPQVVKEAEWKVLYRKHNDNWSIQLYASESALIGGEVRAEASVLIYDQNEQVLCVHREPVHTLTRGQCITMTMAVLSSDQARHMGVIIKPLPY